MPNSVFFSVAVELGLISFTSLVLTQPNFLIQVESKRGRSATAVIGGFFLCVTFCWSVVLGIVLYIHDIVIQF